MTFNAKEEANRFVENFSGMTFSGTTGKEWLKDRLEKMLAIAHAAGLAQGREEENEACAKVCDDLGGVDCSDMPAKIIRQRISGKEKI